MAILQRAGALTAGLLAVLLASGLPTGAQEPGATKTDPAPAKPKQDPSRRVPAYFGQIGLTTEQRAGIYGIQAKRGEKIKALEEQIARERSEMLTECEGVLNETQKKLLADLRKAAEPSSKSESGKGAKPTK